MQMYLLFEEYTFVVLVLLLVKYITSETTK